MKVNDSSFSELSAGSIEMHKKPDARRAPWSWMKELFGGNRVYEVTYHFRLVDKATESFRRAKEGNS